jgi:mRNA interferase MazF
MVNQTYVPQRGDVVWLNFTPQAGHKQAGRRPAVVVSPASYNSKSGLAIFCPVTNRIKGYPFEVRLPEDVPTAGVVLVDQVKSLDWRIRRVEFLCTLPQATLIDVLQKLAPLVQ